MWMGTIKKSATANEKKAPAGLMTSWGPYLLMETVDYGIDTTGLLQTVIDVEA